MMIRQVILHWDLGIKLFHINIIHIYHTFISVFMSLLPGQA